MAPCPATSALVSARRAQPPGSRGLNGAAGSPVCSPPSQLHRPAQRDTQPAAAAAPCQTLLVQHAIFGMYFVAVVRSPLLPLLLALPSLTRAPLPAHHPLRCADPLNLGVNKEALNWYRNAELQNGRWAMLGVAGILVPAGAWGVAEWAGCLQMVLQRPCFTTRAAVTRPAAAVGATC